MKDQPKACTACERKSNHDRCARVDCPSRKQVTARIRGFEHVCSPMVVHASLRPQP